MIFDRVEIAVLSLVWLVAIFVPLEWALPAWPGQRRVRGGLAADMAFFLGQQLVFGVVVITALATLSRWLPPVGPLADARRTFGELPLWSQALIAVVLGDLLMYWGHRLQHRVGWLWRFHAVHHTTRHLDCIAAYREHPLDGLYTQTWMNLPAIALGLRFDAVLGLVAFRSLWAVLIHSNVRVPLGPLGMLLGSPDLHHWHHARDRHAGNYGNLAPYLDWLFGTLHRPAHEPAELGIEEPHPEGYFALLLWPFRRAQERRVTSSAPSPTRAIVREPAASCVTMTESP